MKEKQMKKIMNFRLFLYLAISLIVSTLLSVYVFVSQNSKVILMISVVALIFICLILVLIFKRKFLIFLLVLLFGFLLPVVSIYTKANWINQNLSKNVENCQIIGKIYTRKADLDKKVLKLYLSDVKIISNETEENINGNIFVHISTDNLDVSKLEVGRTIYVNGSIKLYSLQDEELSKAVSKISSGVSGDVYVRAFNVKVAENKSLTIRDNVKQRVYNKTSNVKYGDIGYAMMFGDTSILDPDIKGVFQESGTAHLLAVSGFHVSLVVMLISFVLKKLKANKFTSLGVTVLMLILYAYLCDFSVSVIRAAIMSIVALYATTRAKEYDGLSALSLALVILLVISPLQLFDISLVLSFISVLSIILLMPVFTRLLSKVFYDKIASSLALNFAVQVGLFVTQICYFGKVPVLSFITNLITVPLASFAFMFLICAVVLSFVLPFISPIMSLFGYVMQLLVRFNNFVSGVSIFVETGVVAGFAVILSCVLMFIVSDYVFAKKRTKLALSVITLAFIVSLMII